jgi:hypothetical protein
VFNEKNAQVKKKSLFALFVVNFQKNLKQTCQILGKYCKHNKELVWIVASNKSSLFYCVFDIDLLAHDY